MPRAFIAIHNAGAIPAKMAARGSPSPSCAPLPLQPLQAPPERLVKKFIDIRFDECRIVFMPVKLNPENAPGDELLGFFRAMADPSRLKIVGLLAQQPYAVEQLSALLGIGESTVSHHLARLAAAGLVSARPDGHYSMYSLHQEALAAMARRLLKTDQLPALARGIDRASFDKKVLASFTGPDGRFTAFPTQEKKFLVLLRHVLREFRPGIHYSEKTVNEMLSHFSDDTARLRRSLVEFGFMDREGGGRDYWVKESAPTEARSRREAS
jgi:biotin operon repressor